MPDWAGFELGARRIEPGTRETVDLPVSILPDHSPVSMSVHVIRGKQPGPALFVSAAIHGDEVIGVEIVRRLLRAPYLDDMKGTLLAIPIVNAFGFMNHSRYLPDGRDLNRSFPGSAAGSLAARLAHLFMKEIVARADFGIDLHSAARHRANLPQVRVSPSKPDTSALAEAFGAPIILSSKIRDGSLRQAAAGKGIDVLIYEGGEALRFDEYAVRSGVAGLLRAMHHLEMVSLSETQRPKAAAIWANSSYWVRAPAGGLLRTFKTIGQQVVRGDVLGVISDPFGEKETEIGARHAGLLIGRTVMPTVNEGDALFHIAKLGGDDNAQSAVDSHSSRLDQDPLVDEDEIV